MTTGRRTKIRVREKAGEKGRKPGENRLMNVRIRRQSMEKMQGNLMLGKKMGKVVR